MPSPNQVTSLSTKELETIWKNKPPQIIHLMGWALTFLRTNREGFDKLWNNSVSRQMLEDMAPELLADIISYSVEDKSLAPIQHLMSPHLGFRDLRFDHPSLIASYIENTADHHNEKMLIDILPILFTNNSLKNAVFDHEKDTRSLWIVYFIEQKRMGEPWIKAMIDIFGWDAVNEVASSRFGSTEMFLEVSTPEERLKFWQELPKEKQEELLRHATNDLPHLQSQLLKSTSSDKGRAPSKKM